MPVYEYVCLDCKKEFTETKHVSEYEANTVKCPKCSSKKVEQRWTSVQVTTSRKS